MRCARDVGTIDADVYSSAGKAGGAKVGGEVQVSVRVGLRTLTRVFGDRKEKRIGVSA